jgi:hypothetical protein
LEEIERKNGRIGRLGNLEIPFPFHQSALRSVAAPPLADRVSAVTVTEKRHPVFSRSMPKSGRPADRPGLGGANS